MFECRLSPMQEYLYEFLQCAYRFRGLSCERLLFDITTSSVARFSCYPQAVGCEMSDPTPWMHHLFLRHEMGWILQVLGPRQDNIKNKPRLTYRLLYNRKSSTLVHRLVSSARLPGCNRHCWQYYLQFVRKRYDRLTSQYHICINVLIETRL